MYNVVTGRNVCHTYAVASKLIERVGETRETRAGAVFVAPGPVLTGTKRPWERVLFSSKRDANPFFHLFESIWMLAGSNDGTWLDQFVRDFSSRFAERDGTIHGAYGYRWRKNMFAMDQLKMVADRLSAIPGDRRSVIQMWDAGIDLYSPKDVDDETGLPFPEPRDIPCNTQVYVKIRSDGNLTTTVTCRSNDIVWGCYGANAVHFSVLHEWLAEAVGAEMGPMYQLSDDWHAYEATMDRLDRIVSDPYSSGGVSHMSMFESPESALRDCEQFLSRGPMGNYQNPWFHAVAEPMLVAHKFYRQANRDRCREYIEKIEASDWRQACLEWVGRRWARIDGDLV